MTKKFPAAVAASVALLLSVVPLSAQATAPVPTPAVEECTITGTARADKLVGTAGDDVICGLGGNDTITGGAGDDTIRGGAGNDKVTGGTGDDVISGGTGTDSLTGGAGDDALAGDGGRDGLSGGNGDDALSGGSGTDSLRSGTGDDTCALDSADRRLDSCLIDTDGPAVTFPPSVLEYQAGTTAVFRWDVEDPSGVTWTWAAIGGPSGWVTEWCGFGESAQQIAGTASAGTHELRCDIPANAVNENYTLFVMAADALGNSNSLSWAQLGFTVSGGSDDNRVPDINAVRLPETVRVGETFTVEIDVTDDSGTAGVYSWFVGAAPYYYSDQINGLFIRAVDEASVVSGDSTNGTFRQTLVVSDWAPPGQYSLLVSIRDTVGNRGFIPIGYTITVTE
jgi:hypothetical protein